MLSKLVSASAVLLAGSKLVSAQTFSLCDPVSKHQHCGDDPAAPASVHVDFTTGATDFFKLADGTKLSYDGQNGAVFSISNVDGAPTITSNEYIFFGRVDVVARAAPGPGIVTCFVLQSDDRDEIDFEWTGGDSNSIQSNYFSKGDDSTFTRGQTHSAPNNQDGWHTYSFDWSDKAMVWLVDNNPVRTVKATEAEKGINGYPQTPMQIKLGTWVAGKPGAPDGTVKWSGGLANFDNGPSNGYFKSVTVTNYNKGIDGATAYAYKDASGSMDSIEVKTGGGSKDSSSSPSSSSSSSSSTSSPSKTSSSVSSSATTLLTSTSSSASATDSSTSSSSTGITKPSGTSINSAGIGSNSQVTSTPISAPAAGAAAGKFTTSLGAAMVMSAAAIVGSLLL